jgi:hypothetical protein
MTTNYKQDPSKNFYNDFGLPFSDTIYSVTLTSNTAASITVPGTIGMGMPASVSGTGYPGAQNAYVKGTNKFLAVFSYSVGTGVGDVWVTTTGTAAVPAGASFATTYSELNPKAKYVKAGDVISVISAGTPSVCVAFYSIQDW